MRIISLSPAITEIIYALHAQEDLIANTYLCDYPEEAKKLPKVGSFSSVDYEKIQHLHPDLIITSTVVQQRIFSKLKELGLPVIHTDPRSIEEIINSIGLIGQLIGKEKESSLIQKNMRNVIVELEKHMPHTKLRVYVEEWYDPPMYSGNWVPEVVEIAGGEYFVKEERGMSEETDEYALRQFDPEIIFVSYCGFGTNSDISKVLHRKGWEQVSAIKHKKVFAVNETILNRPGPRILEAAQELQRYIIMNL